MSKLMNSQLWPVFERRDYDTLTRMVNIVNDQEKRNVRLACDKMFRDLWAKEFHERTNAGRA